MQRYHKERERFLCRLDRVGNAVEREVWSVVCRRGWREVWSVVCRRGMEGGVVCGL